MLAELNFAILFFAHCASVAALSRCVIYNFDLFNPLVFDGDYMSTYTAHGPFGRNAYSEDMRNKPRPPGFDIGSHYVTNRDSNDTCLGVSRDKILPVKGGEIQINYCNIGSSHNEYNVTKCSLLLVNTNKSYSKTFNLYTDRREWTQQVFFIEDSVDFPLNIIIICKKIEMGYTIIDSLRYIQHHNLSKSCSFHKTNSPLQLTNITYTLVPPYVSNLNRKNNTFNGGFKRSVMDDAEISSSIKNIQSDDDSVFVLQPKNKENVYSSVKSQLHHSEKYRTEIRERTQSLDSTTLDAKSEKYFKKELSKHINQKSSTAIELSGRHDSNIEYQLEDAKNDDYMELSYNEININQNDLNTIFKRDASDTDKRSNQMKFQQDDFDEESEVRERIMKGYPSVTPISSSTAENTKFSPYKITPKSPTPTPVIKSSSRREAFASSTKGTRHVDSPPLIMTGLKRQKIEPLEINKKFVNTLFDNKHEDPRRCGKTIFQQLMRHWFQRLAPFSIIMAIIAVVGILWCGMAAICYKIGKSKGTDNSWQKMVEVKCRLGETKYGNFADRIMASGRNVCGLGRSQIRRCFDKIAPPIPTTTCEPTYRPTCVSGTVTPCDIIC